MAVKRFRTKIVEIEAIQFDGENYAELQKWTDDKFFHVVEDDRGDDPDIRAEVFDVLHSTWIGVKVGQWIVRGAKGEFYPCDDETFHWKYEEIKFAEGGYIESGKLVRGPVGEDDIVQFLSLEQQRVYYQRNPVRCDYDCDICHQGEDEE